jgi:hypothetical protein
MWTTMTIESAQTQEIGRDPRGVHTNEGKQESERNGDRGHQGRRQGSKEQEEDGQNDKESFGQRFAYGVKRVVHELGAVIDGADPHAVGKGLVQFRHSRPDALKDFARVFPPTHHRDSLHAARCAVQSENAGPRRGADPDDPDIPDEDRHTIG